MSLVSRLTTAIQAIGTDIKALQSASSGPNGALILSAAYTFTNADHNKLVLVDSSSNVTLTFPQALSPGFRVRLWQVGAGIIIPEIAGRVTRSNSTRITSAYPGDTFTAVVTSTSVFTTDFSTPLPTFQQYNTAALSYTTATAAPWTSNLPPIVLEANGTYEIDYRVVFQASVTTASIKMGFADLPSTSNVQLDYKIQIAAPGTAAYRLGSLTAVTGINASGTASVVGTNMLGVISGRITVGANSVTLAPQLSANGTTGTVTVAVGGTSVTARKTYGLPTVSVAYGPEIVSGLDTSAWTKTNGVTVSGTKITATNGGNMIYRSDLLTAGKSYKVELDMTFTAGAQVRINTAAVGAVDAGVINWNVVNGHLSGTFTATGPFLTLEARNATFTGTIDNWSVKEIL